ncbi:hypothetical protein F9U64_22370 [Gracilibacillus oryzae]|uniref:Uncharacterized protein n=1 Tax=Gracilibacillus oryzae TaxID=1672701 RepID=A0A7C8GQ98_9BACI|nr:hypothetical protein [Gracilibacillus oryzae]KAB8125581.1 hypothetical protein F9U64_22370 [Gracilibacillus oryzae]
MKIEIAKMERMAQTGSSLLRLIQNDHTPILDLLIRESVQNSVDAGNNSDWVKYDITTVSFEKSNVTGYFEGIGDKLNARYSEEMQKSIVIRDSNTTGLTGPLHQEYVRNNNFGNLLKLVYEISMPQEKLEAGGSWGLGKTVYFRVGIGLVVYYSRIKNEDGNYESRLAACLVEDETHEDRLLPDESELKRGIAWWGQPHSGSSTKPLTGEGEIRDILQALNVQEYKGDETGTTVIIPFINQETLIPKRESNMPFWWYSNIDAYLYVALQRWYSPRIDNELYPYGAYLKASVNNQDILKEKMEPVFSLVNSLYTLASSGEWISSLNIDKGMVNVEEIKLYRTFNNNIAGRTAFVKVTKDILKMGVPNNKRSPLEYLDLEASDNNNPPIVLYLRKPGMVINYETDGKWTNGIEKTSEEEYIIGIFVPDSENMVTASDAGISLDQYLRQGEKADHASWSDIILGDRKLTIVERIQKNVSTTIRQTYNDTEKEKGSSKSGALSKALAKILLPPVGFGKSPGGGTNPPSGGSRGSKQNTGKLQIEKTEFGEENTLILDFYINLPKNTTYLEIDLQIESEGSKKFKGNEWEKDSEVGVPFPVEIMGLSVSDNSGNECKHFLVKTDRFKKNSKVRIETTDIDQVKGKLILDKKDPMIQPSLQENFIKDGAI